jgi:hypothetical protein
MKPLTFDRRFDDVMFGEDFRKPDEAMIYEYGTIME